MTLYKTLDANGRSCYGGNTRWSLPTRNADGTWTPGEWMPAIVGELVACENGYHLADDAQVLEWLTKRLFVAEYRGERIDADNKTVVREVRLVREITAWNERTQRLFAVWCAREALRLVDRPDQRSVAACDVAERYANGEATDGELDAAWVAARDAARVAAWVAARVAARVAAMDAAMDAQYRQLLAMLGGDA
jgi:hypothetical protein